MTCVRCNKATLILLVYPSIVLDRLVATPCFIDEGEEDKFKQIFQFEAENIIHRVSQNNLTQFFYESDK